MLVTAFLTALVLGVLMLDYSALMEPVDSLILVREVVLAGVGFAIVVLIVLWLPGWFVFAVVAALLERLGQQAAATIAAGFLALFVAGAGSLLFGPLLYFSGYAGLVIGPMIAWRVWRDA